MVQMYSVGGFSGRDVIFTKKYPVTAVKLTHRGEGMLYRTLWVDEKSKTIFDFIPRLASDFCQPHSSATHICCTTSMTRSTTSVPTAQLLTFLFKPVSCFRSTSLYLPPRANKAQEKTYRKLGTLRPSFFFRKVQGSLWSIVSLSLCNTWSRSVVTVS